MSLKAIKELLSAYEDCVGKSEIGAAAQAEISALEKAAEALSSAGALRDLSAFEDTKDASALMESVAKEET